MSERKVLNKYYPPDFDPSKIPRMKLARNRQYTVRLMAPFNMRCKTCGEYIYKGKKFNARKEDVEGDDYLGIRIYRFYIKCTRCLQEISFKTDPKNTDYEIEAGATRNFMALKLAEEQAQREEDDEKEEEATNPMKLLEKRTQQSKQELELLESLEELKDLNRRQQTINYDEMLAQYDNQAARERAIKEQEKLDEEYVKSIFRKKLATGTVAEEEIVELTADERSQPPVKMLKTNSGHASNRVSSSLSCTIGSSEATKSAILAPPRTTEAKSGNSSAPWETKKAIPSLRNSFSNLVKKKVASGLAKTVDSIHAKCPMESAEKVDSCGGDATPTITEPTLRTGSIDEKPKGLSLVCSYSSSSGAESD